jgi:dienelactone hydrolase
MHWGAEDVVDDRGVRRRRFDVECEGRAVPGLLWTPADAAGARPLVLIGHGGSHHKRQDYVTALAGRLVRHHGYAAAAVDGPVHGDRRADGGADTTLTFLEFGQAWSGVPALTDAMVADWRATLDALRAVPEVGDGPCGYWGLSMGTIFGIPLVAAEERVRAAVLGLMGMTGPTRPRLIADAPRLRCPVLFLAQWDDELFPRDTAFSLFDALGSSDKRLHAHPGRHGQVPGEEFSLTEAFLRRHLGAVAAATSVAREAGTGRVPA